MHAHIVLAHPESKSFNGHLAGLAQECLEKQGWRVSITDLYKNQFDPCERLSHYIDPKDTARFFVQNEQRHAGETKTLADEIKKEIQLLDTSDLLILQYPMWWHLPPAILKGWLDRVFVYGEVYTSSKRFENGRFSGKKAMISVTVGTSRETYAYNGRSGDIDLMLWLVNFSLAFVGYTVLSPFVAYGVESGIQYTGADAVTKRLNQIEQDLLCRLKTINDVPTIPFNTMGEWGDDGRIIKSAKAYSPFIRHKENLDLG
nr:NAD(P)H-dependent oxidoreductase [uncultured Desulfobacter sp.]